ncbi:hypothetical protein [Actinomadura chibensis]|uniref:Secreted protein n=1 Tax=Actinomadura chibensis TaxID=392828 RepID=A0A5D0NI88_9ACTN|nr:hypothetical protein [Actinomadura chibensis]TYB44054.1 hypothetical protein FXF69_24160 [Actinomadura chibensis]
MRKAILAGTSLVVAALAAGPVAAPALAAPGKADTSCEARLFADEVTVRDLGPNGIAADGWSVHCSADSQVRVDIDYVTGRHVTSAANVAAGDQWQGLDLTPSPDGRGTNAVVSVYEGRELLTQEAINWD